MLYFLRHFESVVSKVSMKAVFGECQMFHSTDPSRKKKELDVSDILSRGRMDITHHYDKNYF